MSENKQTHEICEECGQWLDLVVWCPLGCKYNSAEDSMHSHDSSALGQWED